MFTDSRDERDIYRSIVTIARAMDERDWTVIEELTVADVTGDLGSGAVNSAAELVALLRRYLDECGPTQHMIGNVLIDVEGDTATSRAYVSDMHLGSGDLEGQYFRTLGDYHDTWVRTPAGWRLRSRIKRHSGVMGNIDVVTHAL